MKYINSGGVYLGNDTSHESFPDNFARNRGKAFVQSSSKKWLCHFFDSLLSCPAAAGRAGLLLHQDDVLSEPADPVPGDIAVLLPAQQAEQPPPSWEH